VLESFLEGNYSAFFRKVLDCTVTKLPPSPEEDQEKGDISALFYAFQPSLSEAPFDHL
jgi:hypothetical protein